jgi:hypothetical protein
MLHQTHSAFQQQIVNEATTLAYASIASEGNKRTDMIITATSDKRGNK